MKRNKQMIFLLISILVYVLYVPDIENEISLLKEKIRYLNMKIEKEKSIKKNRDKILSEIEKSLKIAKENEKLIFKNEKLSEIQGKLESYLKNIALDSKVNFLGASWEEPLVYDDKNYEEIPITSSIKGTPPTAALFINRIYKFEKIVQIKNLEIGKTRPFSLLFSFKISGYKLLSFKNSEKEMKKK